MKISKIPVSAKSRKLYANWTLQESQDLDQDVVSEFAKILQEQIDKEVLMTIKAEEFVKQGWFMIPFTVKNSIDWFNENIQDEYAMILGKMYFKSHEDAVLYSLTWSDNETAHTQ